MRKTVLLLALLSTAVLAAPSAPTDEASIAAGKKLYMRNCSTCHGQGGAGDGPAATALATKPRDLRTEPLKFGDSDEAIFKTITNGVKASGMTAFAQLPEKDRWNLVAYVKSLHKK